MSAEYSAEPTAESSSAPQHAAPGKVPVRGIAMILLAVGILLIAWGVHHKLSNDSATEIVGTQVTGTATAAPQATQADQAPAGTAAPAATGAPNAGNAPLSSPAPAPAPAPAPPAGPLRDAPIAVWNNSLIQGLAGRVGDTLRGEGWDISEVGNFADEVLPRSAAFFTPGNAAEERVARSVAAQLGIAAEPRPESLRNAPAGVVLILTEDQAR